LSLLLRPPLNRPSFGQANKYEKLHRFPIDACNLKMKMNVHQLVIDACN
jgi:hypothetical protein